MSTTLTRSQVAAWRAEAHETMTADPRLPACAVLDSVGEVFQLCDALIEAWNDYHAHPAGEPVANDSKGDG